MFSYLKILRQAYEVTRANKPLWVLGLFLGWTGIFNLSSFSRQDQSTQYQNQINNWLNVHQSAAIMIAVLFLIVLVVLAYLFFRAKAGLILGLKAILDKRATDFGKSFKQGGLFYRRIFRAYFLIYLGVILAGLLLSIPIIYLIALKLDFRAIVLIIFALIIFIPISLIALFLEVLSPLFVVLYDLTVTEAIKSSFDLFIKFWPQLVAFGFCILFTVLVVFFVSLFGLIIIFTPIVFLIHLFYYKVAVFVLGGAIFLIIQSGLAVFQQTAWVLVFQELVKPQKIEGELEPEAAPEIV